MNNKIKIAILDSGIDKTHKRLKGLNFVNSINFSTSTDPGLQDGHGTSICDCIRKCIEKSENQDGFEIYDLRVFSGRNNIEEESIVKALEFCRDEKIDIINLSIGVIAVVTPPEKLYKICNEIVSGGSIIVAATDNFGNICYPADFKFVCGVKAGLIDNWSQYGYDEPTGNFIGKGGFQRLAELDGKCAFRAGSSYATGHITGLLGLHLQKNKDIPLKSSLSKFREKANTDIRIINSEKGQKLLTQFNVITSSEIKNIIKDCFPSEKFSWIKNVAIYPFSNKEFGALKYFSNQFEHNITDLLDFPHSVIEHGTVVIGDKKYKVKLNPQDLNSEYDTLILGYAEDIASMVNAHYYSDLLKSVKNSKNVFCLDPRTYDEITGSIASDAHSHKIYCPIVRQSDYDKITSINSLGKLKKPVIAVTGSSSQSGKFSVQLKLRELLQKEGYSVGWLTTEPQGELFGANFSFPFGFSPSVRLPVENWTSFLKGVMKGIETSTDCDILITGHQSGLLVAESCKVNNTAFIHGVQPDVIVCSLFVTDTMEYIERIINVFKWYYQIPILFFALSEIEKTWIKDESGELLIKNTLMPKAKWEEHAKRIEEKFNIPVVNAFSNEYDSTIINVITNFFS